MPKNNFWKSVAITAALGFLYFGMLRKLGYDWWNDPNYSHGLLIPFLLAYILWCERCRLEEIPKEPKVLLGAAGVVLAVFTLFAGIAGAELFLQRLSLVLMLGSLALYFWGRGVFRIILLPLLLLLMAIPIPTIVFNKIAFPLQLFASRCAVSAMSFFDIPVLREGNIIELMPLGSTQTKKLEVVEACSGIRSLMTLATLAVVLAYFTRPGSNSSGGSEGNQKWWMYSGFWRGVLLLLAAVPIAIITNAARVSGTGILARYYGTQVAEGFFHSFSGWAIYIVASLLLFGAAWIIDQIFRLARGPGRSGRISNPEAAALTGE